VSYRTLKVLNSDFLTKNRQETFLFSFRADFEKTTLLGQNQLIFVFFEQKRKKKNSFLNFFEFSDCQSQISDFEWQKLWTDQKFGLSQKVAPGTTIYRHVFKNKRWWKLSRRLQPLAQLLQVPCNYSFFLFPQNYYARIWVLWFALWLWTRSLREGCELPDF